MGNEVTQDQLDEFKATGENSIAADPVTPAGGKNKKRSADKAGGGNSADKVADVTPQPAAPGKGVNHNRSADKKSMKESIEQIFEGADISEEFMEKAEVIFEAAINERVEETAVEMAEAFEVQLAEELETFVTETANKLDKYLDYVVEQYMDDNELAIESGIKVQVSESLIAGLKDLVESHNVSVDADETDIIEELEGAMEEMAGDMNTVINENIELRKMISEATEASVFEDVSEGLTDTEIDKFATLSEGISYDDVGEYKRKLDIIRESYFSTGTAPQSLNESADELDPIEREENDIVHDVDMKRYADAIDRSL